MPVIFLARGLLLAVAFFVVKDKFSAMIIYTLNEGFLVTAVQNKWVLDKGC